MSFGPKKYTLTDCDREPIHELGHIQPFGALIAVNGDWMVAHYSVNFGEMLGIEKTPGIGVKLVDLLGEDLVKLLQRTTGKLTNADSVERLFGVRLESGDLFDIALHGSGPLTIIEFEPHAEQEFGDHLSAIRPLMAELDPIEDVDQLCKRGAALIKQLLGFDRVMVYRFHADQSGEVIAEAREKHLEAFYGLRYPATDIPQQARTLYLRNRFRIISDINADPVPIEPEKSFTGEPVDLSLSTLRAVSPIHIEYLKNMGVGASLSISIIHRGKLWGLFACHHYSPRILPYSLRTTAELFSQLFSLMLERAVMTAGDRLRDQGRRIHDQIMARLVGGTSLLDSLPTLDAVLSEVIPYDGSSVYVDDLYRSRGSAPAEEEFLAILPTLNSAATSRVVATTALSEQIPAASEFADRAVGAMIIPVSRRPRDYLILWRRELTQTVNWAGDPAKSVTETEDGVRLSPRKSFASWQESVTGRSSDWLDEERQIAENLRVTLLEVILRLTDDAVQERTRAQEQQELLIAELNHRVRNILNLIRSLISQSRHEAMEIDDFTDLIGGRIGALASAHDNITRQNWNPAPVSALLEAEAQAYLQGKEDRLAITGEDMLIAPEAYTVLALVIHEMVTNSAKYGSLCDSKGRLDVDLETMKDGSLKIEWRERGGPPVRAPERRGFGSTIIERSIPYELKGDAQISYKLGGVEAEFVIPGRFVSPVKGKRKLASKEVAANGSEAGAPRMSSLPGNVLLIEDSMIIAMDTEESLKSLGIEDICTVGSVPAALDAIERKAPELAIVDYNLGDESSDLVIADLKKRGIPFVIASGYGELEEKMEELGAFAMIRKPYGLDDLREILSELAD